MASAAKTTVLLSCGGQSTKLTVLVDGVNNPVNPGVVADCVVSNVNENNLVILVGRVLVDPVGVQNSQSSELTPGTLLGNRAQITLKLELRNTLVLGLTIHNTLRDGSLPASSADSDSVDNVALFGLVTETASLVRSRGTGDAHNAGKLTILPTSYTLQKPQHIRLLLAP